jgi:hypothetical protein
MATELNEKTIEAARKFTEVLCSQCQHKLSQGQSVPFADAILVRSIKEIDQMLAQDNISADVRATLEWVTYKRELI